MRVIYLQARRHNGHTSLSMENLFTTLLDGMVCFSCEQILCSGDIWLVGARQGEDKWKEKESLDTSDQFRKQVEYFAANYFSHVLTLPDNSCYGNIMLSEPDRG